MSTEEELAEIRAHVKALEEHTSEHGPKVWQHDYDTPGGASWRTPWAPVPWARREETVELQQTEVAASRSEEPVDDGGLEPPKGPYPLSDEERKPDAVLNFQSEVPKGKKLFPRSTVVTEVDRGALGF